MFIMQNENKNPLFILLKFLSETALLINKPGITTSWLYPAIY